MNATLVADTWPALLTIPTPGQSTHIVIVGDLTTGDTTTSALHTDADQQLRDHGYTRTGRWTDRPDWRLHTARVKRAA